jgi:hypothetical protein
MTGLSERCQHVLEASWTVGERDGVPFAYTRPSPDRYRWQWYWDSCFAAIAWRHFEPGRSRAELEPRIVAHHAKVTADRDLDGDGLLWILQPDESGLDASPQFDPIWRHEAQGLPGFVELVRRNREREFRVEAVRADGGPLVCEVLTNVIHGLSRLALSLPSITPALIARCYDEPSGLFLPAVMPPIKARIPVTVAALSPLALRYWRGPSWINSAWLVWRGIVRLGYEEQADTLARAITETVAREGLREFYDPYDGRGMGAQDFAWSALSLELLDPNDASVGVAASPG